MKYYVAITLIALSAPVDASWSFEDRTTEEKVANMQSAIIETAEAIVSEMTKAMSVFPEVEEPNWNDFDSLVKFLKKDYEELKKLKGQDAEGNGKDSLEMLPSNPSVHRMEEKPSVKELLRLEEKR